MKTSDLPIVTPCGEDFRAMRPLDRGRYCDHCKMIVHDLSAMTSKEARELLSSPRTEKLCVRYLYDAHGAIVFRDLPASPLGRARKVLAAVLALVVPTSVAACARREMMGSPPMPPYEEYSGGEGGLDGAVPSAEGASRDSGGSTAAPSSR
jgi:hypothetical protein